MLLLFTQQTLGIRRKIDYKYIDTLGEYNLILFN